jgi:hypothetical protein
MGRCNVARDPGRPPSNDPPRDGLARSLLGALMREAAPAPTEHPALDVLLAHAAGTLAEEQRPAVQAHLGVCGSCVQTLRDLQPFLAAADPAEAAVDLETIAGWKRLQPALRARLAEDAAPAVRAGKDETAAPPGEASGSRRRAAAGSPVFAVAATLLVIATSGLLVQNYRLDSRLAIYERPSAAVPVLFVEARDRRSGDSASQRFEVPAHAPAFLLTISSSEFPATGCCTIEIATDAGETRWSGEGAPDDLGALRVSIPTRFLPAGVYWIVAGTPSASLPGVEAAAPLVRERIEIAYR